MRSTFSQGGTHLKKFLFKMNNDSIKIKDLLAIVFGLDTTNLNVVEVTVYKSQIIIQVEDLTDGRFYLYKIDGKVRLNLASKNTKAELSAEK